MSMICLGVLLVAALPALGAAGSGGGEDSAFCQPERTERLPGGGYCHAQPLDAGMRVGPGATAAGSNPPIKIVNRGSDYLYYASQSIMRSVGGRWIKMRLPGGRFTPASAPFVPMESVTGCVGPATAAKWPSGKYLWALTVRAVGKSGSAERHVLRAVFPLRAR
jgi:hypothetical protein